MNMQFYHKKRYGLMVLSAIVVASFLSNTVLAQTTAFTYQGKLSNNNTPATGTYDMQFKLFDALTDGNQVGATITNPTVAVANGVFTVQLDFGAGTFDGTPRYLEICVRAAGDTNNYTLLAPRQAFSSIPYAMHSTNAATADGLSSTCAGCVTNNQIETVDGAKITGNVDGGQISGEIPTASVPEGSNNYIQNSVAAAKAGKTSIKQAGGFDIDGDGVIGSLAIGTTTPTDGTKLDVSGGPIRLTQSNNRLLQLGSPNTETGMTIKYNQPTASRADIRFNGSLLKLVAVSGDVVPPNQNGIAIDTAGNVGIGTTSPRAKLDVSGNAVQDRDKGGIVKAAVYIHPTGFIINCYNGTNGTSTGDCGFHVSKNGDGLYSIDFGFRVTDRFISATTSTTIFPLTPTTLTCVQVAFSPFSNDSTLIVRTFVPNVDQGFADSYFYIVVY